ncbi:MAG: hypothetical protein V4819_03230 [Verrucomicrobiota bacterium]
MSCVFDQVVLLREEADARSRGYRFEQMLREILPWSARPPLAVVAKSEQLDGFFEWNGWHFVVEAKAKVGIILRGSHDWEDFELKVRRRPNSIGLFCCLYEVAESVLSAAEELNRNGFGALVISGNAWDNLRSDPLPFDVLLRNMVWNARSRFLPAPRPPAEIRTWAYDLQRTKANLVSEFRDMSGIFLRRHRHPKHDLIYVRRDLDTSIETVAQSLRPSQLSIHQKTRTSHNHSFVQDKSVPTQLCLIRDTSGAGKTTLAVNIALQDQEYLGCGRAALQPDIDDISRLWQNRSKQSLIQELISIDRPIIYCIDSLDEAKESPQKKREVMALMKLVGELNTLAVDTGLMAFPIALVFTIRDDYWREWESIFEGAGGKVFINRFSTFTPNEFEQALDKYSNAFHFSFTAPLTGDGKSVLATPFNLQVFSEAFEYGGPTSPLSFLDRNVLSLFFDRRCDNIIRRQIPGLTAFQLMRISGTLAMSCVRARANAISKQDAINKLSDCNPLLKSVADQILLALRSDHILRQDAISVQAIGFRHIKFVEYLVAYHVVECLSSSGNFDQLHKDTADIFESGLVSMFKVHEYIRHVTNTYFEETKNSIESFYAKSSAFMTPFVRNLRFAVGHGAQTSTEDLRLVLKNLDESNPELAWEAFFILAAKNNAQEPTVLIRTFDLTWSINGHRTDRWKLLEKMARHGLLLEENVFLRVAHSNVAKEWEVFLGACLRRDLGTEFRCTWECLAGNEVLRNLRLLPAQDWGTVLHLLNCLIESKPFVFGDVI